MNDDVLRLEEIMKGELSLDMQDEFFEIIKSSELLMPVTYAENGEAFSINYLTDADGVNALPLFTSERTVKEADIECSLYPIQAREVADILKQTDKYSVIAVNPFTQYDVNIPSDAFLNIFEPSDDITEKLNEMIGVLKTHSVRLEENTTLFLRSDENVMIDGAVDGVFTPDVPFCVSSNPKYGEDLKYTNILLMPESRYVLYIGKDNDLDVVIAPGCEFHLEDVMDGTTNLWMCGEQPFFDE